MLPGPAMRSLCLGALLTLLTPACVFDLAPLETASGTAGSGGGCPAGTSDADEDASNGCELALPLGGAGLALWLRADQGVERTPDQQVSGWRDLSGRKFHTFYRTSNDCPAAPTLTTGEIGSLPTVSFGGNSCLEDVTARTVAFDQGLSVAVVEVIRASTDYGLFFEMYGQDGLYLGRNGNSDRFVAGVTHAADKDGQGKLSSTTLSALPVLTSQPTLFVFTLDPEGLPALRRNGEPVAIEQLVDGVATTRSPRPRSGDYHLALGSNASQSALLDGALGEVMVFERVLTPSEISSLEASLQQRWACCSP